MRTLLLVAAALAAPPAVRAEDWKKVETPTFEALLPCAQPKLEEQAMETQIGQARMRMWQCETKDAFAALSTVEYPADAVAKAVPAKMLDGARDGALANINGTLEREVPILLDSGQPKKKWPGREFAGVTPAGIVYEARIYLVDNRLYQLALVHPKASDVAATFKKLADSFKLKPPLKAAR